MTANAKKAAWVRERAEWFQMRRGTWGLFTGLTNRMIDSEAFQALRSVHSVKVLVWFWRLAEYPRKKRKPGQESPIGNLKKIVNCKDLSFTYLIASYLGMRPDQFAPALRELFKYGFIDIVEHGRGIRGEWTQFAYSDRWKAYGTPQWAELPFPIGDKVGWQKKKKNTYYGKPELLTTQSRSYKVVETGTDYGFAELKTPISTDLQTTHNRSSLRSTKPSTSLNGDRRDGKRFEEKEESNSAPTRRDDAAIYSPHKAELEWNVRSILGQLPDLSFGKWDISWFVSQLQAARKRDLDPDKVRRGMEARGLDGFTIDILLTVAGIVIPEADDIQIHIPEASAVTVEAAQ
jgi:hypothetical protein